MSDQFYLLTGDDRDRLRQVTNLVRRQSRTTRNREPVEEEIGQTPDLYVARVPAGGIAAPTVVGTGTGVTAEETVYAAYCWIYQLLPNWQTTPAQGTLQSIAGYTLPVFSLQTVSGDTWVLVERDKFGTWWAVGGPGVSGGGGSITVENVAHTVVVGGANTIDIGSGLTVTDEGGGKARIDATAPGSLTVETVGATLVISNVTTIEIGVGITLLNDGGKAELKTALEALDKTGAIKDNNVWKIQTDPFGILFWADVGTGTPNSGHVQLNINLPILFEQNVVFIGGPTWDIFNYPLTITTSGDGYILLDAPLEICGFQFWCCAVVPQWLGDKNDVDLTASLGTGSPLSHDKTVYLVSSSMPVNLTGIIPATLAGAAGPQVIAIVNKGSFPISIINDSGSSSSANRILLPHDTSGSGAGEFLLNPDDVVVLWWDSCFLHQWRIFSSTCVFGKSGTGHSPGWVPDPQSVISNPYRVLKERAEWTNIHKPYRGSGLTGTVNDFNPANDYGDTWLLDAASGGATITGIVNNGVVKDGVQIRIKNTDVNSVMTISHMNAGSGAANQIYCPGEADFFLFPSEFCDLIYVEADLRWEVLTSERGLAAVSDTDHQLGYLKFKLVQGTNISIVQENVGGDEDLKINCTLFSGITGVTTSVTQSFVTAVSCSGSTLTVTSKTLSLSFNQGICTAASIV